MEHLKDNYKKILCICQKGNSRSVALAWLLKMKYKQDAIAMGIQKNFEETKEMLYKWADIIILTSNRYESKIPEEYKNKLKVWHIGTDIWFRRFDDDLINKFEVFIERDNFMKITP